jgi:SAM-dependent methyltransferase
MAAHPYLLTNAETQAEDRFRALSALYDATTFASFEQTGIKPGWRCWEVGAGGPSVALGMAQRCMPGGFVLATDIDISRTKQANQPFKVLQHDAATEGPPSKDFDLVHARLVLQHIQQRERAFQNMFDSLKPGGWMIIEDFDSVLVPQACLDAQNEDEYRANKIRKGLIKLLEARGVDRSYGSKLLRLFRSAGLQNVSVEMGLSVTNPAGRMLERANVAQTAPGLVKIGAASDAEINAHLLALVNEKIDVTFPAMFTAIGQKMLE